MIKLHSIVAYVNPLPDEQFNNGDPIPYRVIEDRDTRVLLEPVWYNAGEIRPTHTAVKINLRLSFSQHTDVLVPAFVSFDEWQDTSWYNDETASVSFQINEEYKLRLWIYSDEYIAEANKNDPYAKDDPYIKYVLCLEDEDGNITMGRKANTDEDIIKTIAEFKADWQTLVETEEWC